MCRQIIKWKEISVPIQVSRVEFEVSVHFFKLWMSLRYYIVYYVIKKNSRTLLFKKSYPYRILSFARSLLSVLILLYST